MILRCKEALPPHGPRLAENSGLIAAQLSPARTRARPLISWPIVLDDRVSMVTPAPLRLGVGMERLLSILVSSRSLRSAGRHAPKRSLRLKLGLLFGVIAALAVILPASVQAYLQLKDARAGVSSQNLALARMAAKLVDETVTQTRQSLDMVATSPSVVAAARDR